MMLPLVNPTAKLDLFINKLHKPFAPAEVEQHRNLSMNRNYAILGTKWIGYQFRARQVGSPGRIDEILVLVLPWRQIELDSPSPVLAFFHGH